MRILHAIPAVAIRYGGPSVAIRGLAAAQAAAGHRVDVVTTDADGPARLSVRLDDPQPADGYSVRYFGRTLPGEWKLSIGLARWLSAHVSEYDVVHVHGLFCHTTAAACRSARAAGVPYIVRPLGTLDAWSLAQRRWKKAPYYYAIERWHLRHAAAIHATSLAEAEAVASLGFGSRVRVVELGVDTSRAASARGYEGDAAGPFRVAYLARLHHKKGLPLLLDAIARLAGDGVDARLEVVGDGAPEYEEEMRRRVASLEIGDRVRFRGRLEGDAKWEALAGADVFALPSSQENFGISVVEAMIAGCAVVVSDQVAIARDVAAADAGVVVPLDVAALTRALGALAADRGRVASAGQRARRFALARYSWERAATELDAVYASVVREAKERVA